MKKDTSYHDFVVYDLMAKLPDITSRPMMGGWCIYSNKIPFSIITDNQLYFKAKGTFAEKLIAEGFQKFSYKKSNGKTMSMSYYLVPDELIDNQELFDESVREVLKNCL